jgi:hypothetical protein
MHSNFNDLKHGTMEDLIIALILGFAVWHDWKNNNGLFK